ncbi:extracellular solute-binding protein [Aeromicrobium sp. 179-A 4D2 NHS]|uniref:extracellular solute-binding protein n=1 Tax=Aeromicrobium sp. 179-A 4D2 NHS TaxID=3142375 RepID=UPI0039A1737E
MKLRTFMASAAVTGLALTALAACGSGGDDDSSDSGSDTVTLWLAGKEDTPQEATDWLTEEFAAKHDGKTLKIERIDWGELLTRLNTALPSDKSPDVVEVGNTQAASFTSIGAFTDLTDKADELGPMGPESFVEAGTWEGKLYAVPYYWGSRYVFYSKKAFKDAGLDVPTSLADFSTAAEKLATQGDDKYSGFWVPGQDWRNGISWIFAHGGDIAVQEGDQWVGKLSSPESVKGLQQWQKLAQDATSAPKDGKDEEAWTPFNNGEAAMFMAPGWARWSVAEDKADDLGAFALPGVGGDAAPVFAGGSNIAVSAKSKNQDLGFEVLKLIYSDDYQKLLAKNGLGPANDEFTSLMGDDEFAKAAIASASNSKLTPTSPNWAAVETSSVMEEFFGAIASGEDVAATAKATDAKLEAELNK